MLRIARFAAPVAGLHGHLPAGGRLPRVSGFGLDNRYVRTGEDRTEADHTQAGHEDEISDHSSASDRLTVPNPGLIPPIAMEPRR